LKALQGSQKVILWHRLAKSPRQSPEHSEEWKVYKKHSQAKAALGHSGKPHSLKATSLKIIYQKTSSANGKFTSKTKQNKTKQKTKPKKSPTSKRNT
jgi:hypothetical protein